MITIARFGAVSGSALIMVLTAAGCGADSAPSPSPTPSATARVTSSAPEVPTESPTAAIPEPTTTNTLPPPPPATAPAPSRAGALTDASLPVPAGWRSVAPKGGEEEGYLGNGTWTLGRDPRYAATESITMGCAPITRDDFPDPTAALEGHLERAGRPGIVLTMQFADTGRATSYFEVYRRQVASCTDPDVLTATIEPSATALVDRRTYSDQGEWTEVARQVGKRMTIMLLSDPGHAITGAQTRAIADQIETHSTR